MSNIEYNKIFAAILLAGLVAMLSGFVSRLLVAPKLLAENIYIVAAPEGKPIAGNENVGPEPIGPLLASADIDKGQKSAKACLTCHSFNAGGPMKIGPNLWNIVNAPMARDPSFVYSKNLKDMGKDWTYENLNLLLYKPKAFIKGTKMSYPGLKKVIDRANLVAWLRTLSNSPAPIPQ